MATAWDKYQELVKNVGNTKGADGYASVTGLCGDTMDIWLKVKYDTIIQATFMTDGCSTTIAAGSMVTELAKGKNISQALRTNQESVLSALDGLPEESKHCALLAANALKAAVKDYLAFNKEPWKRAYEKR